MLYPDIARPRQATPGSKSRYLPLSFVEPHKNYSIWFSRVGTEPLVICDIPQKLYLLRAMENAALPTPDLTNQECRPGASPSFEVHFGQKRHVKIPYDIE